MSDRPHDAEPVIDPATLPVGEVKPHAGRAVAKNYLARAEQRRIFWLFMPPACVLMLFLGWLERSWLSGPAAPAVPQIDTRIEPVSDDPALADAVVIEADADAAFGEAEELGASTSALGKVKDDTMFRGAEQEAWFQLWLTLRSSDMRSLARASVPRVSFAELHGQPTTYRGRLVRFRGTLHRLEQLKAPPNDYDIVDYWQGWLEPDGGPVSPIVVYFLRLPPGMPHGMRIREEVDVVGFFLKRWAYAATDAVRVAPLVMALEPIWKPRPAASPAAVSISTFALVTIGALVLVTAVAIGLAGRGSRPVEPPPTDLSAALADVPTVDTLDSLRRLADADRAAGRATSEETSP